MSSVQERREQKREADLKAAAEQSKKFAESQVSGQGISKQQFEQKKKQAGSTALASAGFSQTPSQQIVSDSEKRRREDAARERALERIRQRVPFTDDRARVSARGVQPRPTQQTAQPSEGVAQGPVKDQTIEDFAFKEFQGPPAPAKPVVGIPPAPVSSALSGIGLLVPREEAKQQPKEFVKLPIGGTVQPKRKEDPLRVAFETAKTRGLEIGSSVIAVPSKIAENIKLGIEGKPPSPQQVAFDFLRREPAKPIKEFVEQERKPTALDALISGQEFRGTQSEQAVSFATDIGIIVAPIGPKGTTQVRSAVSGLTQKIKVAQVAKQVKEPGVVQGVEKLGKDVFIISKGVEEQAGQVPLTIVRFGKESRFQGGEVLEIRPVKESLVPSETAIRGSVDPTTKQILGLEAKTEFQFVSKQISQEARQLLQQGQFSGALKVIAEGKGAPIKAVTKGQTEILQQFTKGPKTQTTLFGETQAQKFTLPDATRQVSKIKKSGTPFDISASKPSKGTAGSAGKSQALSPKTEKIIRDLITPKPQPKTRAAPPLLFAPQTEIQQPITFPPKTPEIVTKQPKQQTGIETGLSDLDREVQRLITPIGPETKQESQLQITDLTVQTPKTKQPQIIIPSITPKKTQKTGTPLIPDITTKPPITILPPVQKQPPILTQPPFVPQTTRTIPPTTPTILQPPTRAPPTTPPIRIPPVRFPFIFPGGLRDFVRSRPTPTKRRFIADPADPLRAGVIAAEGVDQLVGTNRKVFKQIDINLAKSRKRARSFDPLLGLKGRKKPKKVKGFNFRIKI